MLKECAVDCQVLYNRNRRVTDKDYSPECNYQLCEYKCFSDPLPTIDYSTYDVYYLYEIVDKVVQKIKPMFLEKEEYDIEEIIDRIPEIPAKFVVEGISSVIRKRIPLYNRYGYPSFLQEDGNRYFLVSENDFYITTKPDVLSSYYTLNLIGIEPHTIQETTYLIRKEADQQAVLQILQEEEGDLEDTIENIKDTKQLILLIENILSKPTKTPSEKIVLNKYKNFIFEVPEPTTKIQEEYDKINKPRTGRGRTPNRDKKPQIERLKEEITLEEYLGDDIDNEKVLVHILNLLKIDATGYKISSDYFKADTDVRILKDGVWETVATTEIIPYNTVIQIMIKNLLDEYLVKSKLFGTIMPDGNFRIVDKTDENPDAKKNLHLEKKGTTCKNLDRTYILLYLAEFNISPPSNEFKIKSIPLREAKSTVTGLLKELSTGLSDEKIKLIAQWIATGLNKEQLCSYIENYMDENDLIFRALQK
jgi:hypothetical protein